jgi:hypothetical protein
VVEGRDKGNGRLNSRGLNHMGSGGIANCGRPTRWRLCASRRASFDDECLQKFRDALALIEKENLGARVMHLRHSGLTTRRTFSR